MTPENYGLIVASITNAPSGTEVICVAVKGYNDKGHPYSICGLGVTKYVAAGLMQLCRFHDREMHKREKSGQNTSV